MKNLKKILKHYFSFWLIPIFLIAILVRWLYLPQKAVSFAYDQARDAFIVREMLGGHLKILGPPVSGVPGLFHGVLYYYVIAPAYFFGQGNPVAVAYYLSFISSLGVFAVYYLAFLLTKSKLPALFSALIFAFSFEASQYANLLTNASMGVWFVPVIYIGLFLWINKKSKWAPVITGLGFGLSVQSEVALLYHLAPIILWLFLFRKNIFRNQIFTFAAAFLFAIFPMIISEIKFGFTGIRGIIYLLMSQDGIVQSKNLSDFIITFLNQSGRSFAYTLFPINVVFGGLLGFLMIIFSLKTKELWPKFLASYIFAYLIALPFGGWNMKHILVGVAPAVAVLAGIFIYKNFSKNKLILILILAIVVLSNTFKIIKENIKGQTIFPLQGDLILSKEISLVDYTYQRADGKPFSISSLTSPLFVNTLWSYLYNWYGKDRYGYLPYWVGRNQVGQLGDNLQTAASGIPLHYFIIEPTYGIPELWVTYAKGDQDAISSLVSEKKFGEIVIQERKIR